MVLCLELSVMSSNRSEVLKAIRKVLPSPPGLAMFHSSISNLVPPPNFSKWDVLWAIRVLCREGWTFAFPSFTFSFCSSGRVDLDTPNSETGLLSNWVMELEGASRTQDPIYSCVVIGPRSGELMNTDGPHPFAEGSLFSLLDRENASIVLFGASLDSSTLFHLYEYERDLPYRRSKHFEGIVKWGGKTVVKSVVLQVRDETVGAENDFEPLISRLQERSAVETAPLWRGKVHAVSASAVSSLASSLLDEDPLCFVANKVSIRHRIEQIQQADASKPIHIALLGNANLEFLKLHTAQQLQPATLGRCFEILTLPFAQLAQEKIAWSKSLSDFEPDITIFCSTIEDLLMSDSAAIHRPEAALEVARDYGSLVASFLNDFKGRVMIHTFTASRAVNTSLAQRYFELVTECNQILKTELGDSSRLVWIDTSVEAARCQSPVFDSRIWHLAKSPFSDGFSQHLSQIWMAAALEVAGKSARAVVVDLDNTLWGGVVGEDGIEGIRLGGDFPGNAFSDFQRALRDLKTQGVVLAIASKNDEVIVDEVLSRHPGMVLRKEDFALIKANWNRKSESILEICAGLNLGLESILFIDDNPVERNEVATNLPGVRILPLPVDPSLYVDALLSCPYLGGSHAQIETIDRSASYEVLSALKAIEREPHEKQLEFISKLGMVVYFQVLSDFNLERATQLCQKTNQFNVTTKRYSAQDLTELSKNGADVVVIGLQDRYLKRENIGLVILKSAGNRVGTGEIDSLMLSCRVLGRGLEDLIIDWVIARAKQRGWRLIEGSIIETPRNTPVRELYSRNGFSLKGGGVWFRETEAMERREGYEVFDEVGPWA